MAKHRSSKTISPIYHSTAILKEAHGKPKHDRYRHIWTEADIPQWKIDKANTMRNNPTQLERILFAALHRKFPNNRPRIYRQEIKYGYILDFYIPHLKLCVEADGPMHNALNDAFRDKHLLKGQIRTIRFSVSDLNTPPEVLDKLLHARIYPKRR